MWVSYIKTLSLTAIHGVLASEAIAHSEKPDTVRTGQEVTAPAAIDGPLTAYEMHYGFPQRQLDKSTSFGRD